MYTASRLGFWVLCTMSTFAYICHYSSSLICMLCLSSKAWSRTGLAWVIQNQKISTLSMKSKNTRDLIIYEEKKRLYIVHAARQRDSKKKIYMPVTTEEQDEWGSIIHDGKQSMFFLLFFLSRKRRKIQVLPSVTFIPCSLQVFLWYFIRACPTTTEYSTLFFWKNRKKIIKHANKQANKKNMYISLSVANFTSSDCKNMKPSGQQGKKKWFCRGALTFFDTCVFTFISSSFPSESLINNISPSRLPRFSCVLVRIYAYP